MFSPTPRTHARWIASTATTLAALVFSAVLAPSAMAISTVPTDLGSAAPYSVLAGAAATVPGSILPGEVGAIGAIAGDAGSQFGSLLHSSNDSATQIALSDAAAATATLNQRPATASLTSSDLGGQTLLPGVYRSGAAFAVTGTLTFDAQGDPDAVFVVQTAAALNTTAATTMSLTNGAQASNIFWVVGGATTLGAASAFTGTILSGAAITVGAGSRIHGRAISLSGAVTLDSTTFIAIPAPVIAPVTPLPETPAPVAPVEIVPTVVPVEVTPAVVPLVIPVAVPVAVPVVIPVAVPVVVPVVVAPAVAPVISITGGSGVVFTRTATPTISGTTDAPAGSAVTIKISSTLHAATVAADGTWTVPAGAARRDGTTAIVATVTTMAGTGTTKQTLIVDTIAPRVTVAGGAAPFTTVTSPTLSGTASEVAIGSAVAVTVGGRVYATTAGPQGVWTVPVNDTLPEGLTTVVATAVDRAGNVGTGTQARTVDTIAPAISVTGGATALTKVARAGFSGTSNAPVGSKVAVKVAGQITTTTVTAAQTWRIVLATALTDGSSSATIIVVDKAGNVGSTAQTITVDTVAPTLTVAGGATATVTRALPKITGTTDAPAGSTVTVKLGSRTLSASVTPDSTWSVTPTVMLAEGVIAVTATITDPAGNLRTATQSLTVDAFNEHSSTTTVYFSAGSAVVSTEAAAALTTLTRSVPAGAVRVRVTVVGNQTTSETTSTALAVARATAVSTAARARLAGTYLLSGGNAGVLGEAAQRVVITVRYEIPVN